MTLATLGIQQNGDAPSLPEAHRSVPVPHAQGWWRRFLAFAGPGLMVSVGYMDPGNWATDLAGGSHFGYALLWVVLVANLTATLLQILCARLGLVTGQDLAQACRSYYRRPAVLALWTLSELGIVACDLAEVVGSAVALNLLFGIPLVAGVLLTGLDVLLLLALTRYGFRMLEAVVLVLVGTIGACFTWELFLARPDLGGLVHGLFVPTLPGPQALYISLGILGATVMPHNLYLHSSLVQSRAFDRGPEGMKDAIHHNTVDTVVSLGLAFFVNAAILVLSAAVFYGSGHHVLALKEAHELLHPILGGAASVVFAVALLAAGQSSTITGTLAGQIVMEGFLKLRMKPGLRRLLTRGLAVIPAVVMIGLTGEDRTVDLLVLSQVVLSMQLPFAVFPLVEFTSDPKVMGRHANGPWVRILGFAVASGITALNLWLLYTVIGSLWLGALLLLGAGYALWVRFLYREPSRA